MIELPATHRPQFFTGQGQPCRADITLTAHASQRETMHIFTSSSYANCCLRLTGPQFFMGQWQPAQQSRYHAHNTRIWNDAYAKVQRRIRDNTCHFPADHSVAASNILACVPSWYSDYTLFRWEEIALLRKHERQLWLGNLMGTHLLVAAAELPLGYTIDLSKLANHFPAGFPFLSLSWRRCFCQWKCAPHQPHLPDFLQLHTFYICPIQRTRGAAAIQLQPNKEHDVKTHILKKTKSNVGKLKSQTKTNTTHACSAGLYSGYRCRNLQYQTKGHRRTATACSGSGCLAQPIRVWISGRFYRARCSWLNSF